MSNFTGPLVIEYDQHASEVLNGTYWRVKESFRFYLPRTAQCGNEWNEYVSNVWAFCPAGMLTDLASIPQVFQNVLGPAGPYVQAAVLHDQLCEYLSITENGAPKPITRKQCDDILLSAMVDLGVSTLQAQTIYDAVSLYRVLDNVTAASSTPLKRSLEASYNFEGLK